MTFENFDDELDISAAAKVLPRSQSDIRNANEGRVKHSQPIPNEDVAFGSREAADITATGQPLPTVKIGKQEAARFAFVPGQPLKHAKIHFRVGLGSYRCLSQDGTKKECCNLDGEPKDCLVGLVFRYANAEPSTGRLPKDKQPAVALQVIRLSRSNLRDITKLGINDENEVSNPTTFDIIMTHDQSRAFGYKFQAAQVLRWKDLGDAPLDLVKPFADGVALSRRLGKTLSSTEVTDSGDDHQAIKSKLDNITEDDFN